MKILVYQVIQYIPIPNEGKLVSPPSSTSDKYLYLEYDLISYKNGTLW